MYKLSGQIYRQDMKTNSGITTKRGKREYDMMKKFLSGPLLLLKCNVAEIHMHVF